MNKRDIREVVKSIVRLYEFRGSSLAFMGLGFVLMAEASPFSPTGFATKIPVSTIEKFTASFLNILEVIGLVLFFNGLLHIRGERVGKRTGRVENKAPRIRKAPGSSLLALVEYFYSPKLVEGVFKPIVADWRSEYFESLQEGRSRKAAWINARYLFSFVMAMGLSKVFSFIRSVAKK